MNRRCTGSSGFTLVEVLVATMLLTIVMTAVYTLFFTVISTWRSEENDEGLHRKARNVLTVLEGEYANLHAGGSQFFEGTNDEFTMFVVTQPMDVEAGEGRHLLRVQYRYDRANRTLEREEALVEGALPAVAINPAEFDPGRIQVGRPERFTVATNVTDFAVRYLWIERPDAEYWRNKPVPVTPKVAARHRIGLGFPQAIEIEITLAGARDPGQSLLVTSRLPTRAYTRQRDAWELSRMLEELR